MTLPAFKEPISSHAAPRTRAVLAVRALLCAAALVLSLGLAGLILAPAALAQSPPPTATDPAAAPAAAPPIAVDPPAVVPEQPSGWNAGVEVKKAPTAGKFNTTVIERSGDKAAAAGAQALKLVALLTDNGQEIDQGLVWRIFQHSADPGAKSKLIVESRDASPVLKLPPGDYTVNAAFGRANLTRKVTLKTGAGATEQFVLNAGGLRLSALVGGKPAQPGTVTYSVFSDDHDQFDGRTAVMAGAKPSLIVRLNAGIYRVVSIYGDANAKVESDVTVEAGKLTEATVAHTAGKVSFKLVTRQGGEALPDTHWTIQTQNGDPVKESVGALPTHVLAPGDYTVTAKSAGHIFTRQFAVKDNDTLSIEVLMDKNAPVAEPVRATAAPADAAEGTGAQGTGAEGTGTEGTGAEGTGAEGTGAIAPNLEIKIP